MYTYEKLYRLCSQDSSDSDIAHYLLKHLGSLRQLTIKKVIDEVGISKASLHRFFNKGGYESFKDLITILDEEVKQKKMFNVKYEQYRTNMALCTQETEFEDAQIGKLIKAVKNAKRVVFYGNAWEISCFKRFSFYLFNQGVDIILLDRWDLNEIYQILNSLETQDVFIMVETAWKIQILYENSTNIHHVLNLEIVNGLRFHKFFIGEANCDQYLNFNNIRVPYKYDYMPYIPLNLLDEKILDLL